jgi:hypothetical protein
VEHLGVEYGSLTLMEHLGVHCGSLTLVEHLGVDCGSDSARSGRGGGFWLSRGVAPCGVSNWLPWSISESNNRTSII